jgi:hypothetical protein
MWMRRAAVILLTAAVACQSNKAPPPAPMGKPGGGSIGNLGGDSPENWERRGSFEVAGIFLSADRQKGVRVNGQDLCRSERP